MRVCRSIVALCVISMLLIGSFAEPSARAEPSPQGAVTATPGPDSAAGLEATAEIMPVDASPQCAKPLDVLILMDVTSSMGAQLEIAKQQSAALITTLRREVPDSRFGIASVADYPGVFGSTSDYPWQLDQPITDDVAKVEAALQRVQLLHGGDTPESYVRALYEAQDTWRIGWRTRSRHMVIFWGDSTAHDPDPGVDRQLGTGDDLHFTDVLSTTRDYGIHLYTITFGQEQAFRQMSTATDGEFYRAHEAAELPALITKAVQQACVSIATPSFGQLLLRLGTIRGRVNPWCLLPLLPLLLIGFVIWKRSQVRRAIRSGMPLPPLSTPPSVPPAVPPSAPAVPPLPIARPVHTQYRPALVIGVGNAGRWTLTYLKQTFVEQPRVSDVALLALDLPTSLDGQAAQRITAPGATIGDDSAEVELCEQEIIWLQGDPEALAGRIRQHPDSYPILYHWLNALTGIAPHIRVRLGFLDEMPSISSRLNTALSELARRHGTDIYLVGSLGEAIGAATMIDLAQTIRIIARRNGAEIALHALTFLPDVADAARLPDESALADAAASWRTLDRLQTTFGQEYPTPLAFDPPLINLAHDQARLEEKLFSTVTLLSADRIVASLVNTPPQFGMYPMAADIISATLEEPSATMLHEHRANVNGRVGATQQLLDTALYSSAGAFTYRLHPAAIIQEGASRVLLQLAAAELAAATTVDAHAFYASLHKISPYALYQYAESIPAHHAWTLDSILTLIDSPADLAALRTYTHDGLARYVRHALLSTGERGNEAIRQLVESYYQEHLRDAPTPGTWAASVEANSEVTVQIFRNHLFQEVAGMLNRRRPGAVQQALVLAETVASHLHTLQHSLEAHRQRRESDLQDLRSTRQTPTAKAASSFSFWRRLLGYVSSQVEEQQLTHHQTWLNTELELLATTHAASAAQHMQMITQQLHQQIQAYMQLLSSEQTCAQQVLQAAQQRREAQIALGRVRHDWGMPHTDVTQLRVYLHNDRELSQQDPRRQQLAALRAYVSGEHLAPLLLPESAGAQQLRERIFWTWQPDSEEPRLCPLLAEGGPLVGLASDRSAPAPMTGRVLQAAAAALHSSIWDLRLPDLLCREWDVPRTLAAQLDGERTAPAIRYLPTQNDRHELHTFLLVPPASDPKTAHFFEAVVAAQGEAGVQKVSHRLLSGSDAYRVSFLPTYELIGALQPGALPAYDQLRQSYADQMAEQRCAAITVNEALASCYEQQRTIIRRWLHPHLVDALVDPRRIELFARAVLSGTISLDPRTGQVRIVGGNTTTPHSSPTTISDQRSPWLAALRWFVLAAPLEAVQHVEKLMQAMWTSISVNAYDQWIDSGLPAELRGSSSVTEQDLALLLQAILDPIFDSNPG